MPLMMQQYLLLQRNLVYTGITRGKKLLVLIGQRKALAMAVRNNRTVRRPVEFFPHWRRTGQLVGQFPTLASPWADAAPG